MELKEIWNMLQPVIMMLIVSKVDHSAYLLLVTLLPIVLQVSQAMYTKYGKTPIATVIVKSRYSLASNHANTTNTDAMEGVSYKLIACANSVPGLLIPKSILKYIHNAEERSKFRDAYRPHAFPVPHGDFAFSFRGIPCQASIQVSIEDKTETTTVTLSSAKCSTKVLQEFVQEGIDEKWERENLRRDNVYIQRVYTLGVGCLWFMNQLTVEKTFKNVYISKSLQHDIESDLDTFIQREDLFKQQGIPHKRGFLFYGPPGTGKTSCIYAIAHKLKCSVFMMSLKELTVSIKDAIGKIHEPCIILFEEIDFQISADLTTVPDEDKSKNGNKPKKNNELISELMGILDGYSCDMRKCIIIMTTNHKEDIPNALIRPGRIDRHFYFGPCDAKEATRVARLFTGIDDLPEPQNSDVSISSAELINRVLLPNTDNKEALVQEMLALSSNK